MTPIRLIAVVTLASCGLFLASPVMPAAPTPDTSAAAGFSGSGAVPTQYRRGDKDRSRARERDRRDFRDRDRGGYRWDYDRRERWKTKRHPRYQHWKGRRLHSRGRFLVITNYWDYGLHRPPRGYYYVRDGNDVFLVLEATRLIVDSFILFELLRQ